MPFRRAPALARNEPRQVCDSSHRNGHALNGNDSSVRKLFRRVRRIALDRLSPRSRGAFATIAGCWATAICEVIYEGDCEEKNEFGARPGRGEGRRQLRRNVSSRAGPTAKGVYTWENGARLEGTFKSRQGQRARGLRLGDRRPLRRTISTTASSTTLKGADCPGDAGPPQLLTPLAPRRSPIRHNREAAHAPARRRCRRVRVAYARTGESPFASESNADRRLVALGRLPPLRRCAASRGVASAQDAYPSKPITLIVPFPPGGVADIVGRPFAEALSRELKTPVIIENKPGAGGGIGMGAVAKAKPDGYTLLIALSSISILPEADKVLGRAPLYQLDQFTPIARLTADPTVLAVRADSPWKTLAGFVADARRRPGAITLRVVRQLRHDARADGDVRAQRRRQAAARPFTGGGPRSSRCSAGKSTRCRRARPR